MLFLVDIDDTLIRSKKDICPDCNHVKRYIDATPIQEEIDLVNKAFDLGHTIILFTGRHWDKYDQTKEQTKEFGIKHDELVMGKPPGYIIDDMSSLSIRAFFEEAK